MSLIIIIILKFFIYQLTQLQSLDQGIIIRTFKLYLNGWNGLLLDANPSLITKSKYVRKKDISINSIISNKNIDTCEFHISRNSNYSSINPKHVINGKSY